MMEDIMEIKCRGCKELFIQTYCNNFFCKRCQKEKQKNTRKKWSFING